MVVYLPPIDNLELSATALSFLRLNHIYYIGDVAQRSRSELLSLQGASNETVLEIDLALRRRGMLLGQRLEDIGYVPRPNSPQV